MEEEFKTPPDWFWRRMLQKWHFKRPSRDSKQLKYALKYNRKTKGRNADFIIRLCTFPYLHR